MDTDLRTLEGVIPIDSKSPSDIHAYTAKRGGKKILKRGETCVCIPIPRVPCLTAGKSRRKKKDLSSFSPLNSKFDEGSNHPQTVLLAHTINVGTSIKILSRTGDEDTES